MTIANILTSSSNCCFDLSGYRFSRGRLVFLSSQNFLTFLWYPYQCFASQEIDIFWKISSELAMISVSLSFLKPTSGVHGSMLLLFPVWAFWAHLLACEMSLLKGRIVKDAGFLNWRINHFTNITQKSWGNDFRVVPTKG